MKKLVLLATALYGTTVAVAQTGSTIRITNPLPVERTDELVVLSRTFLTGKLGKLPARGYVQVAQNGRPRVVQFDDLNGDGTWDEAVFLHTFKPGEKALFTVTATDQPATIKAVVRAHVRQRHKQPDESFALSVKQDTMPYNNVPTDFGKQKLPPYLTEGPAWENDKIGFRKYFDTRNANDIWGKVTSRMVLDEVGVDPSKSYHHFDSSWGMDILKVGKALGAGGLALLTQINGRDSVVRFGRHVGQETYEQVADGPVRAIFRIRYHNWKIGGLPKPVDATEEISIWGGQYFYENKVTVTGAPAGSKLASGIIDFYTPAYDSLQTASVAGIYTWGQQSENKDRLGLALLAPAKDDAGPAHLMTGDVSNAFVIRQHIGKGPLVHRLFVGWEKTDPQFATREGFGRLLATAAQQMGTPLQIR